MKKFVVGYLNFYDNEILLLKVEAESSYEAVKKAMVEFCTTEEGRLEELEWQANEEYPDNFNDLSDMLYNSDTAINVIEI